MCREPAYCILSAYCIVSAALSTASSFRIWNSSTGILSLPGASVKNSAHDKGHEEGGSAYTKAGSSLRSPPGNSRASTPKPESDYFLLCALTYTSDFTGGCPPLPLSEKRVSLQLQLISPGCDSVSTYKLLWKSSSLPERFFRPHVIVQSLPTVRGRRCSKLSKYRFLWVVKRLIRNCIGEGFFTYWANVCC